MHIITCVFIAYLATSVIVEAKCPVWQYPNTLFFDDCRHCGVCKGDIPYNDKCKTEGDLYNNHKLRCIYDGTNRMGCDAINPSLVDVTACTEHFFWGSSCPLKCGSGQVTITCNKFNGTKALWSSVDANCNGNTLEHEMKWLGNGKEVDFPSSLTSTKAADTAPNSLITAKGGFLQLWTIATETTLRTPRGSLEQEKDPTPRNISILLGILLVVGPVVAVTWIAVHIKRKRSRNAHLQQHVEMTTIEQAQNDARASTPLNGTHDGTSWNMSQNEEEEDQSTHHTSIPKIDPVLDPNHIPSKTGGSIREQPGSTTSGFSTCSLALHPIKATGPSEPYRFIPTYHCQEVPIHVATITLHGDNNQDECGVHKPVEVDDEPSLHRPLISDRFLHNDCHLYSAGDETQCKEIDSDGPMLKSDQLNANEVGGNTLSKEVDAPHTYPTISLSLPCGSTASPNISKAGLCLDDTPCSHASSVSSLALEGLSTLSLPKRTGHTGQNRREQCVVDVQGSDEVTQTISTGSFSLSLPNLSAGSHSSLFEQCSASRNSMKKKNEYQQIVNNHSLKASVSAHDNNLSTRENIISRKSCHNSNLSMSELNLDGLDENKSLLQN